MVAHFGYVARIVAPLMVGYFANSNVTIEAIKNYSAALIVIFTIITGLVAQVMVLVVSALPEKEKDPGRIDALERNIKELHGELNIQFHLSVFCIALISFATVADEQIKTSASLHPAYVMAVSALVAHSIMRSLLLPKMIFGLQRLKIISLRRANDGSGVPEAPKPERRYRKVG